MSKEFSTIPTSRDLLVKNLENSIGVTLIKGRKGEPIGTIKDWKGEKYQKQADGKWTEYVEKKANEKETLGLRNSMIAMATELGDQEYVDYLKSKATFKDLLRRKKGLEEAVAEKNRERLSDSLDGVEKVSEEPDTNKSIDEDINPFTEFFEKSHITEAFDSSNNFVNKKGKEIKAMIFPILEKELGDKEEYKIKMEAILAQLPIPPFEEWSEYVFRGVKDRLESLPKKYPWNWGYPSGEKLMSSSSDGERDFINEFLQKQEETLTEEHRRLISEYHKVCEKYIDECVEVIKLQTLQNSLDDEDRYQLTIYQASLLGF